MTEKDFLQALADNKWELQVYASEDDHSPGLTVGLVGTFYFEQNQQNQRIALIKAIEKYQAFCGQTLRSGYFHTTHTEAFTEKAQQCFLDYLAHSQPDTVCRFEWSSEENSWSEYVGDYNIAAHLPTLDDEVNKQALSAFRFYVPLEQIANKPALIELVLDISNILQPLTALFGLAMQTTYHDEFRASEYEVTHHFYGIDLQTLRPNIVDYREEIVSFNWLTILDQRFVNQLGGIKQLQNEFQAQPEIKIHPYAHGAAIQAGEFPQLINAQETPYPDSYVAINAILKSIRTKKAISLTQMDSMDGSENYLKQPKEWVERFDNSPIPQ